MDELEIQDVQPVEYIVLNDNARIRHLHEENLALRKRVREQRKNIKGLSNAYNNSCVLIDVLTRIDKNWKSHYDILYKQSENRFWFKVLLSINAITLSLVIAIITGRI